MQTNGLNLTCTQTILSHCFEFVLQGCLSEWDRASARLPMYFSPRGSGQDVVQENWILKKNDFFFWCRNEISLSFFFFFFFFFFFSFSLSLSVCLSVSLFLFYFILFFMNKRWSFEQPFWQIEVFKNQTNLFD